MYLHVYNQLKIVAISGPTMLIFITPYRQVSTTMLIIRGDTKWCTCTILVPYFFTLFVSQHRHIILV